MISTPTPSSATAQAHQAIDRWVSDHFEEEVAFLQGLVRVPTDTPPGDNAPHAEHTAQALSALGLPVERVPVPSAAVHGQGLRSITNLIVRVPLGPGGPTIALNAHGDVVPPGDGWQHDPYGGNVVDGKLYGRAAAVSKSDFATYTFALMALRHVAKTQPIALSGTVELHFTYDEEFGGELGPAWLLQHGHTRPDLMVAAGFSHDVVVAHNGCLQLEVTVRGDMAHAAIPDTGTDALQGAVHILQALYAQNREHMAVRSAIPGIDHPYLNVGWIQGGTNTNVVPGQVVFKLDRRMIPEENPTDVEANLRAQIAAVARSYSPARGGSALQVDVRRLLLAQALKPSEGQAPLVAALQKHGEAVFGHPLPAVGTPLYTDVRLYGARGIPGVLYGAGPRTVRESNAKRADEHVTLADLQGATRVVARALLDLLQPA
jgi:succinyl-diaminopimelate desuccinylase